MRHYVRIERGRASGFGHPSRRRPYFRRPHCVGDGFTRILEIVGVGYKAEVKPGALQLALGYSHPVVFPLPQGITAEVEANTVIKLSGMDKELLGQTAARIRMLRRPDAYKNKGIRYRGERLVKKVGKAAGK